jgi:putative helicase MOV10L1
MQRVPHTTQNHTQGQEERIIFISTTLSRPESLPPPSATAAAAAAALPPTMAAATAATAAAGGAASASAPAHDAAAAAAAAAAAGAVLDAPVGVWRNPKRFNVAITRAKALLVVVGSPQVLATDECWAQLLRHCVAR